LIAIHAHGQVSADPIGGAITGTATCSRFHLVPLCTANGEIVVLSARNRATNGSDAYPSAVAPRWVAALPHCGLS
jgi:hypothetical protein